MIEEKNVEIDLDYDVDVERGKELRHSKRLDVHCWSDHAEVAHFVGEIYEQLASAGNSNIRKRHLKVVLLDLYVNWCTDSSLKTSFSRHPNDYLAGSIYNELHISKTTIKIADLLTQHGFIEQVKGFKNRLTGRGFISRIWPTEKLTNCFQRARFSLFDVGNSPERRAVILRNENKQDIEYEQTPQTEAMQADLLRYNGLLVKSYISIGSINGAQLPLKANEDPVHVSQNNKFTRRIFNNQSCEFGRRVYGGWWQNCPPQNRLQMITAVQKLATEVA